MPYYSAGDYYRGDYYQGDNYAAGGILGSIGKALGGAVKGFLGGGPLGAFKGAVGAFAKPTIAPLVPYSQPGGPVVPVPGLAGFGQRLIPGGATGYMVLRRRRINPLNIKALRRALRRAKGFEKQARRVGTYFNPGKAYKLKGRKRRPTA